MNLRKKVLAMLLSMSVLPIVIYTAVNFYYGGDITEKLHKDRISTIARISASAFTEILNLSKAKLKLLSSTEAVTGYINTAGINGDDSEQALEFLSEIDSYFKIYVSSQTTFDDIVITDETGTVKASYSNELVGRSFKNAEYFTELIKNENPNYVFISGVIPSPVYANSPDKNCLAFSKKLYNKSGEVKGTLIAYVNANYLAGFLNEIDFGETGLAFIVDADKNILYNNELRYNSSYTAILERHNLHERYKSGQIEDEGLIFDSSLGNERVFYYKFLESDLILILREDLREYTQESNYLLLSGAVSTIAVFVIALFLAVSFSRKLTSPILKLNTAFASGADSGKYVVCDLKQNDELGGMAKSYNSMIKKLEKQFDEINEQKTKNERLAFSDPVTGLSNRNAFEKELGKFIDEGKTGGVVFIDIDGFKQINDIFGHRIGDSLLSKLGQRFMLNGGNFDFYARVSGDQFILIKNGTESDVFTAVSQIVNDLRDPVIVDGSSFNVSVGIGAAFYPDDGTTASELIYKSHKALYSAGRKEKNEIVFFTRDMQNELDRHNRTLSVLRNCIENEEIYMVYQPVIFTKTGKTVAFEALMRIKSKEYGDILPEEFIPVAENEAGIINKLGDWALENVCGFAKKLIDEDNFNGNISVNISAAQLDMDDFVEKVLMTLRRNRLDPRFLQIEVTEKAMLNNTEKNAEKLNTLREHGISVVMDDFGTNYSSFGFLMKLPLDMLKIDKSFIDDIETDYKKMLIIELIIELAHILGFKVLAEGVELKKQYEILLESDCDYIQGYYFSKPVSADRARERLYDK